MSLGSDLEAIETIPLRLMVIAVVVALSVLPAAQALDTLKTRDFLQRASQQLDSIMDTIEVLIVEGPGSVRTKSLDFSSSGDLGFRCLRVGGAPESANSTSVVLVLDNGGTLVRVSPNDEIPVSAKDGGRLEVWRDRFDIRMSAEFEKGRFWVMVEVL